MPPGFTRQFAKRLDGLCAMSICEASHNDRIIPGHVYIAPGDQHLSVRRSGGYYYCELSNGPLVNGHKPAVDVLFESVAESVAAAGVGLLLTGMGQDGAAGLKLMLNAGAVTACQDEITSLIYGMPKAAKTIGAAQHELALQDIAEFILNKTRDATSSAEASS